MSSKHKWLGLLVITVVVLALGATAIFAQDSDDPALPPCGLTGFGGRGMMGNGLHLMRDGDTSPMFTAVADALGIDAQTLISELQSGKTIAELAAEYDLDLTAITAAAQTSMQAHLSDLVASGLITQEQADAHLSAMQDRWEQMPMFNGTGFGMGYGMMHGGRGGMWGNGNNNGSRGMGMMRRGG